MRFDGVGLKPPSNQSLLANVVAADSWNMHALPTHQQGLVAMPIDHLTIRRVHTVDSTITIKFIWGGGKPQLQASERILPILLAFAQRRGRTDWRPHPTIRLPICRTTQRVCLFEISWKRRLYLAIALPPESVSTSSRLPRMDGVKLL